MVSGLLFLEDSMVLMAKDQRYDLGYIIECIQRKGNNLDRRNEIYARYLQILKS